MQQLFLLFNSIAPMSPDLQAYLRSILRKRKYKKKEIILSEGEVCKHIRFIESGLVRVSHWVKNEDVTTWILTERDIFISAASFFGQKPAREQIMAVKDCVTWEITYDELQEICRKFPEFLWHRIAITEAYYMRKDEKEYGTTMLTAAERYALLMETAPELVNRTPLKYLYSYLGMSSASFDRIRAEYKVKKIKK